MFPILLLTISALSRRPQVVARPRRRCPTSLSPTSLHFGDQILNVAHDYNFELALPARLDPLWPRAGGLVVQITPGEFFIADNGIMVTFASATPGVTAGLECVDEGRVAAGKVVATWRLNGDGPHQGRLTMGALAVQRVKVYSFK